MDTELHNLIKLGAVVIQNIQLDLERLDKWLTELVIYLEKKDEHTREDAQWQVVRYGHDKFNILHISFDETCIK